MSKTTPEQKIPFTKRFKQSFATGFAVVLIKGFALLPLSVAQAIGKFIGTLLYWLPNRQRFLAKCNLRAVYPELSQEQRNKLLKQVLQHNAQAICESGAMWRWNQQKLLNAVREVHGLELLEQAFAQGKGVLMLGPHIGNWEVVGNYLAIHYPSTVMYKPPNLQGLEQMMREARGRFGSELVPTDLRGIRQLIKALRSNKLSAILPDQDAGEGAPKVPFMGVPARTMGLVSKLLQKSEAEVLFMVGLRHPQGGFVLHVLPADRDALADADPIKAAMALNQGVEQCIKMAPEQYLWTYRRFRGTPGIYQK
ncbi:Kdo2-lipid IVA lauroyltransferase/acyltransferase [uncultured Thiomicrorhabdus sp.]